MIQPSLDEYMQVAATVSPALMGDYADRTRGILDVWLVQVGEPQSYKELSALAYTLSDSLLMWLLVEKGFVVPADLQSTEEERAAALADGKFEAVRERMATKTSGKGSTKEAPSPHGLYL